MYVTRATIKERERSGSRRRGARRRCRVTLLPSHALAGIRKCSRQHRGTYPPGVLDVLGAVRGGWWVGAVAGVVAGGGCGGYGRAGLVSRCRSDDHHRSLSEEIGTSRSGLPSTKRSLSQHYHVWMIPNQEGSWSGKNQRLICKFLVAFHHQVASQVSCVLYGNLAVFCRTFRHLSP